MYIIESYSLKFIESVVGGAMSYLERREGRTLLPRISDETQGASHR